jgi:sn-glycerol 3-phosphate transport system permease protein
MGAGTAVRGDGQQHDPVARHLLNPFLVWPYAVAPASRRGALVVHLQPLDRYHALCPEQGLVTTGTTGHSRTDAMVLVIIAAAWKQISYNFMFFLAGLQSDTAIADRSRGDRRRQSGTKRFWTIVFPLLSPITFFLMVVNVVYAMFDTFGIIHATTEGGPSAGRPTFWSTRSIRDGFVGQNLGSSAAQSVILMGIVIVLTVIQFRYIERRVNY